VSGLTVEVSDPAATAARWAEVLGLDVMHDGGVATIQLEHARQDLRFVPVAQGRGEAITEVRLTTPREITPVRIAGVRFVSTAGAPDGGSA
jgi:hypothetical protein